MATVAKFMTVANALMKDGSVLLLSKAVKVFSFQLTMKIAVATANIHHVLGEGKRGKSTLDNIRNLIFEVILHKFWQF